MPSPDKQTVIVLEKNDATERQDNLLYFDIWLWICNFQVQIEVVPDWVILLNWTKLLQNHREGVFTGWVGTKHV